MIERYNSNSPEETRAIGEHFAKVHMKPGVVVAVFGDLGAGKTQFTKGVARYFGIDEDELHSPTYSLANEYQVQREGASVQFNHLDCYRFESPEELIELGIEDYLYPRHGMTLIEWADRIKKYLPTPRVDVTITSVDEIERIILIEHIGD